MGSIGQWDGHYPLTSSLGFPIKFKKNNKNNILYNPYGQKNIVPSYNTQNMRKKSLKFYKICENWVIFFLNHNILNCFLIFYNFAHIIFAQNEMIIYVCSSFLTLLSRSLGFLKYIFKDILEFYFNFLQGILCQNWRMF